MKFILNSDPRVLTASILCASTLLAADIGQWDFNSSNLAQTAGANLGSLQYADPTTSTLTVFGTTTALGLPNC